MGRKSAFRQAGSGRCASGDILSFVHFSKVFGQHFLLRVGHIAWVYEGILLFIWGLRTGSKRFRGWVRAGIWQKLFDVISGQPDMQYAMADATIVKVHRHGQGTELKAKP